MRPTGPTDIPIARFAGAGRDDTSRAGVPVSRPGSPGNSAGPGAASPAQVVQFPASIQAGASPALPGVPQILSARLSAMLGQFGIPKDAPAVFALQALMGEGLGLSAETIRAVRAIAFRHAQPRRAAALAARAIAAGLQLDDHGMDALIRSISRLPAEDAGKEPVRVSGRQTSNDSGKDTDGHSSPGSGGSGSGGNDSGQPHQPGQDGQQQAGKPGMVKCECQDEAELRETLESAFVELSSRAASDPGFATLARKGPDGRGWLCVPYRFSIDGVDFSGYFRIVFNYASSKVERLVAEIDSSGLTRVVDVSWAPAGKPKLRFRPGSAAEGGDFSRVFGESMKVELIPQGEDSALMDSDYREVDGHA